MSLRANEFYRFDEFELDCAARLFTRNGQRVTLTPKAFEVLAYLAANPTRLVTKEELMKAVWPDSFVEEGNLAQHISGLRKALGDKASLIATIPGRGYQFATPVVQPRQQLAAPGEVSGEMVVQRVRERVSIVVEEAAPPPLALPPPRRRFQSIAVAVSLFALAIAGGAWWWLTRPEPVTRKVLLAQFQNHSGEPVFEDSLASGLRIDLEQSPYIDLMNHDQIAETLEMMQKPADTPLTGDVAREICERENYEVLLTGEISRIGSQYLLTLEATSCATGKTVAAEKQTIAGPTKVLTAMDDITRRMRHALGEPRRQVAAYDVPIAEATTGSLPALRAYSQALSASDRGDTATAQSLLRKAISLDPNFASAYWQLSANYNNLFDLVQAKDLIQKAYDLRAHTTERERLAIEIAWNFYGTNDWEAAVASMNLYNQIYPNDALVWSRLALAYTALGLHPQAVEAAERAYMLEPHSGVVADNLARIYRRAGRLADAKRIAEAAIAEGKERWGLHSTLFQVAFVAHDEATMQHEAQWGLAHRQPSVAYNDLGLAASSEGKLREAEANFAHAREEAMRNGDNEVADLSWIYETGVQIDFGDMEGARASLKMLHSDAIDPGTTAYFRAVLGDTAPAKRLIAHIVDSHTSSTLSLYFDLTELRAIVDMQEHRPEQAIADLEPGRRYQSRDIGLPYQRGHYEEAAGRLADAEADYRLVLANPGLDPIWPEYCLSHLRLARVLVKEKKNDQARIEYRAFLDSWKNADPGQPLFQDARRELAALH
ncbi:MAG TPA: winged helix-turn-helix domain-containing protein [Terracidiphilus sp.]|nr:winged helix-turn-helix domain-containing protein [Terracidiphilus sp.]